MGNSDSLKHILVDLDGTLLGNRNFSVSIDFVTKALTTLKKYKGWRKSITTLLAIQNEFRRVSSDITNDNRVIKVFAEKMEMSEEKAREFLRASVGDIFPALQKHFYPMPGSKEFLDWASQHFNLILATNPVWPAPIIEMRVKWAGIDPKIFSEITDITKSKACKPSAQYYEDILKRNKIRASECLLVGNELKMDLPATKVGIKTFIVGSYKDLRSIQLKGAKAPAWRGTFKHLRLLLEEILNDPLFFAPKQSSKSSRECAPLKVG